MTGASDSGASAFQASVPADDRSFLYGDSLFETLLAIDGCFLFREFHANRLQGGIAALRFTADATALLEDAERSPGTKEGAASVRLTLSRGSGPRGYLPPKEHSPIVRVLERPLPDNPFKPKAALALASVSTFMAHQPALAGIKHGNRLEQVLAVAEAAEQGADDALVLAYDGAVQCTSSANIFAVYGRHLKTPSCEGAGIRGTRQRLLKERIAPALGLTVEECRLRPEDLATADGAFVSNSLVGFRPIKSIDGKPLNQTIVFDDVFETYVQEAHRCLVA
ncbi:MAG: aminotransferase class IV [Pseudomonadota bacterium]